MNEYAKRYPVFDNDFDLFVLYIGVLDEKLLELVRNKTPVSKKRPASGEKEPMSG